MDSAILVLLLFISLSTVFTQNLEANFSSGDGSSLYSTKCDGEPSCGGFPSNYSANILQVQATKVTLKTTFSVRNSSYVFIIEPVSLDENNDYYFVPTSENKAFERPLGSNISMLTPGQSYLVGICHFSALSSSPGIAATFSGGNFTLTNCLHCFTCFTTRRPYMTLQPPSGTIKVLNISENTVVLSCNATGDPRPSISWTSAPLFRDGLIGVIIPNGINIILNESRGEFNIVSTLILYNFSFSGVECVSSNGGYLPNKSAIFIINQDQQKHILPDDPGISASIAATAGGVTGFLVSICCCFLLCIFMMMCKRRKTRKMSRCNISVQNACPLTNNISVPQKCNPISSENVYIETKDTEEGKILRELRASVSKKLFIPSGSIQVSSVIGQGEFGIVYKGTMKNGGINKVIAVKTMKGLSWSPVDMRNMIDEVMKMEKFDHPNVMSLIGVCMDSDGGGGPSIVMPFMAKGSLLQYLRDNRKNLRVDDEEVEDIEEVRKKLLQFCWQIAKGMDYLSQLKFLHRDLAARNCMIAEDDIIKVADFGLSEDIYTRQYFKSSSGEKMPVKWMAPESLKLCIFSEKTDVWSFGITCWEVFSVGENPYPTVHPHGMIEYLDNGGRLGKPRNTACNQEIYDSILCTWTEESRDRPSFSSLVNTLENHLLAVSQYMEWN